MAPPVIQTSEYVDPVEFTEAGPYKPQPMEALTIVKASQQGRPEYQEDYVVDFMKFVHTTENLSMIIEERAGDGMGCHQDLRRPRHPVRLDVQILPPEAQRHGPQLLHHRRRGKDQQAL